MTHPRSIYDDLPGLSHCPECGAELEAVDVGDHALGDASDIVRRADQQCSGNCTYETTVAFLYLLGDRYVLFGTAQDGQECYRCTADAEYQWLDIRDPIRQACCSEHMKVGVAGKRTVEIAGVAPRSEK